MIRSFANHKLSLRSTWNRNQAVIAEDVLVLPGHNLPFVGLPTRIDELCAHHEARCRAIEEACRRAPCTAADLVPVVFRRVIDDPHQMGFAFSEVLAHVNYMLRANRLRSVNGGSAGVALTAA